MALNEQCYGMLQNLSLKEKTKQIHIYLLIFKANQARRKAALHLALSQNVCPHLKVTLINHNTRPGERNSTWERKNKNAIHSSIQ